MALEAFEQIHESCGFVKEESEIHKDAKDLATEVRKDCNKYMEALRQALAQPEQEPKIKHSLAFCKSIQSRVYVGDKIVSFAKMTLEEAGLMPKRKWVGLTDEEIEELAKWADKHAAPWHLEFARAVEAKLKEKNT